MSSRLLKIANVSLLVGAGLMVLFELQTLTRAEPAVTPPQISTSTSAAEKPQSESACVKQLRPFVEKKATEFGQFVNQHFRADQPTSELVPVAAAKYGELRDSLRTEMEKFFVPGKKVVTTAAASERPACEQFVNENISLMKDLLRQHVIETAYGKKATKLIDRYKTINDKLGRLNFTIAQTYGYFAALSQKLPCNASQCIK